MPKQISPVVKLRGKIDQISFFVSQDGYMARKTGTFNKQKYLTAESYDLTRRNASEFGIAGKAGRVFRNAWNLEIDKAGDNRLISRVTQGMVKVLQSDTVSVYGSRRVEKGDLTMLEKLEFNVALPFIASVKPEIDVTVVRATGQITINFPSYISEKQIAAPYGATHFSFFAAAAAVDFLEETSTTDRDAMADQLFSMTPTTASTIQLTMPANSTLPIFVALGVEFKKIVNGTAFSFSEHTSAMRLLAVDMPQQPGL
jgi:hypothetical protein